MLFLVVLLLFVFLYSPLSLVHATTSNAGSSIGYLTLADYKGLVPRKKSSTFLLPGEKQPISYAKWKKLQADNLFIDKYERCTHSQTLTNCTLHKSLQNVLCITQLYQKSTMKPTTTTTEKKNGVLCLVLLVPCFTCETKV